MFDCRFLENMEGNECLDCTGSSMNQYRRSSTCPVDRAVCRCDTQSQQSQTHTHRRNLVAECHCPRRCRCSDTVVQRYTQQWIGCNENRRKMHSHRRVARTLLEVQALHSNGRCSRRSLTSPISLGLSRCKPLLGSWVTCPAVVCRDRLLLVERDAVRDRSLVSYRTREVDILSSATVVL